MSSTMYIPQTLLLGYTKLSQPQGYLLSDTIAHLCGSQVVTLKKQHPQHDTKGYLIIELINKHFHWNQMKRKCFQES